MLGGLLLAVAAGGGAWLLRGAPPRARQTPLRRGYWYWHHPFRLTPQEERGLTEGRVERLWVHAGTLRGAEAKLTSRQRWLTPLRSEVDAVIRVQPEAIPALLSPGGEQVAARTLEALRLPPWVRGVQWDADVPTARLEEYAQALRRIRRLLPVGYRLGITALPDWLRSRKYAVVAEAVDEISPQFYGNLWPEKGGAPPPLWETRSLTEGIRAAVGGKARVWVGLPAYGRCVVQGQDGTVLGLRHDIDPARLLEDPAWRLLEQKVRREPGSGGPLEFTVRFGNEETAAAGPATIPARGSLWFQWPSAEGLRSTEARLGRHFPTLEGVCYFRWPEQGEAMGLAPESVLGAGGRGALRIRQQRQGEWTHVQVQNEGGDTLGLDGPVKVTVRPSGELLADGPVAWLQGETLVSPLRADRAVLSRPFLRPGESWDVCRVRGTVTVLPPASEVRGGSSTAEH